MDNWDVRRAEDGQLRFDPADLKRLITVETKLVVVNFPHNPTGGVRNTNPRDTHTYLLPPSQRGVRCVTNWVGHAAIRSRMLEDGKARPGCPYRALTVVDVQVRCR